MLNGLTVQGHNLEEVLAMDDLDWDSSHDFIQWLFPNPTPSRRNPRAPLLVAEDIQAFANNTALSANSRRCVLRSMKFLGITYFHGQFMRSYNFRANSRFWLCPASHNHLRITRFLIFCMQMGREDFARGMRDFMVKELSQINDSPHTSMEYWDAAISKRKV